MGVFCVLLLCTVNQVTGGLLDKAPLKPILGTLKSVSDTVASIDIATSLDQRKPRDLGARKPRESNLEFSSPLVATSSTRLLSSPELKEPLTDSFTSSPFEISPIDDVNGFENSNFLIGDPVPKLKLSLSELIVPISKSTPYDVPKTDIMGHPKALVAESLIGNPLDMHNFMGTASRPVIESAKPIVENNAYSSFNPFCDSSSSSFQSMTSLYIDLPSNPINLKKIPPPHIAEDTFPNSGLLEITPSEIYSSFPTVTPFVSSLTDKDNSSILPEQCLENADMALHTQLSRSIPSSSLIMTPYDSYTQHLPTDNPYLPLQSVYEPFRRYCPALCNIQSESSMFEVTPNNSPPCPNFVNLPESTIIESFSQPECSPLMYDNPSLASSNAFDLVNRPPLVASFSSISTIRPKLFRTSDAPCESPIALPMETLITDLPPPIEYIPTVIPPLLPLPIATIPSIPNPIGDTFCTDNPELSLPLLTTQICPKLSPKEYIKSICSSINTELPTFNGEFNNFNALEITDFKTKLSEPKACFVPNAEVVDPICTFPPALGPENLIPYYSSDFFNSMAASSVQPFSSITLDASPNIPDCSTSIFMPSQMTYLPPHTTPAIKFEQTTSCDNNDNFYYTYNGLSSATPGLVTPFNNVPVVTEAVPTSLTLDVPNPFANYPAPYPIVSDVCTPDINEKRLVPMTPNTVYLPHTNDKFVSPIVLENFEVLNSGSIFEIPASNSFCNEFVGSMRSDLYNSKPYVHKELPIYNLNLALPTPNNIDVGLILTGSDSLTDGCMSDFTTSISRPLSVIPNIVEKMSPLIASCIDSVVDIPTGPEIPSISSVIGNDIVCTKNYILLKPPTLLPVSYVNISPSSTLASSTAKAVSSINAVASDIAKSVVTSFSSYIKSMSIPNEELPSVPDHYQTISALSNLDSSKFVYPSSIPLSIAPLHSSLPAVPIYSSPTYLPSTVIPSHGSISSTPWVVSPMNTNIDAQVLVNLMLLSESLKGETLKQEVIDSIIASCLY